METITRRGLVTTAAGAFAVTALSACSSGAGSSASTGSASASASSDSTTTSGLSAQEEEGKLHVFIQHEEETPEWIAALPAAKDEKTTQLFVVAALGMDKTTASISMHERGADGKWKQVLSTPGFVGRDGLCEDEKHKEGGYYQTPIGTYHFNKAFGIAPDPGCTGFDYVKVNKNMYWSGETQEGLHYNEMINIKDFLDADFKNSKRIIDYEYEYQYCLNISFNEDARPGKGSAIFLHCLDESNPYTRGGIAVPEYTMQTILQRVKSDCVVVIDTLENMNGKL